MIHVLWLILLIALPVAAQNVSVPVDSIWSIPRTITASFAVAPLRKNSTTGAFEAIPGQRVATTLAALQPVMVVNFPGQKSTPMTVWGVRFYHSGAGTGWEMPEHPTNIVFRTALIVPAGRKMICRYDMPIGRVGSVACAVANP